MKNYLKELNEAQLKPTLHLDGPLMVIAGAGSGKTRVLTYRIAHLMENGVDPFQILSLTFTNKAAKEMKSRIALMVGDQEAKNLWMGTFHSVFARILRIESEKLGYPSNFTIYDTQDSNSLLSSIIKEMQLDKDLYKTKQIRSRISSFKNSLITVRAYFNNPELQEADQIARRPKMGDLYKAYVDRCFKAGAMDFDDLLLKTNELFTRFPESLAKYQNRFRYILVDEYQDTNHSQYLIVRALADRFQNICVVGDDAQSIYGFRGANINNILNFQRDYSDAVLYRLEQNYRSTKTIVEAANSIIEHNKNKIDKEVWTNNTSGDKIEVHRALTDGEEGRFVASSIFENKMNHQAYNKDFAVLYRTNAQSRSIEDALRKKDIKYRIFGGLSFYQRKEIKDALAYMRIGINPSDEEALKRIINFPPRGIGQTTMTKLIAKANELNISIYALLSQLQHIDISINQGTKIKLENFYHLIENFRTMSQKSNAFDFAEYIVKSTQLIKEFGKDGSIEAISRVDNIEELLNGIKDFVEEKEENSEETTIQKYMEDVALISDLDTKDEDTDLVSLMTIHLAKGLEFPYVYIVGMEENLFPNAMSINSRTELEEERRLFYVALTRAEKKATLSYTLNRYRWGKLIDAEPSRFLEEIDPQYLNWKLPIENTSFEPLLSKNLFGDVDKKKLRLKINNTERNKSFTPKKSLKPLLSTTSKPAQISHLNVGDKVKHTKFGIGIINKMEGNGVDTKASVEFKGFGIKNLVLRFAQLEKIN